MNSARRTFLLPDPEALLDALGAESVQALHHRHGLVEESETNWAGHLGRQLLDGHANPRVRIVLILYVAGFGMDVPQGKTDDVDGLLLPPGDGIELDVWRVDTVGATIVVTFATIAGGCGGACSGLVGGGRCSNCGGIQ